MGSLYSPNKVAASRLRKNFNRTYRNISIGDLVRTPDGKIGEYQGISTFTHPNLISVILYKTDELEDRVIHEIPDIFHYNEDLRLGVPKEVPVHFSLQDVPKITPPEELSGRKRSYLNI